MSGGRMRRVDEAVREVLSGAITQELIDVLAIANALRVTLPIGELSDF